ncbi:MAG: TPM domain-containing protein, partial [Sphaerochaetaceae bacterium]|nr:TPM domain-containing protein [Sphaerochaetaceae bacterium]
MKKALFILLLLVSLLPLFAGNHILDEAQLLTSEEFASASEILDYYSSECNMDLVFISIASSNGMTTDEYAKTYFEKQGYKDGAIYCLNLENYDFYIAFLGAAREKIIYEAVELIQDFALQFMDYEGYLGSITAFGKYSSVFIQDPEEALWAYDQYYSSLLSSRFVDDADLLTMAQEAAIGMYLEYYSEACSMDFVVVTVNSTNGKSARDYADDYMDEHGYNDGILYLLDMGNREWYVSTAGKAINIFTEDILDELESYIVYYLQNGDYYTSFLVFIDYAGGYSANNLDKESTWDYVEA